MQSVLLSSTSSLELLLTAQRDQVILRTNLIDFNTTWDKGMIMVESSANFAVIYFINS